MRVDVHLSEPRIEHELQELDGRLRGAGLMAHDGWRPSPVCDVSVLVRETPDHRFVYLKDARFDHLVGQFSFDVVPPRGGPAAVVMPHAKLRREYRRLGLARWVYRGELLRGACLISSARQSASAARLWAGLAQEFAHGYVWVGGRTARFLGHEIDDTQRVQLPVRQLLHPHGVDPIGLFAEPRARRRPG